MLTDSDLAFYNSYEDRRSTNREHIKLAAYGLSHGSC